MGPPHHSSTIISDCILLSKCGTSYSWPQPCSPYFRFSFLLCCFVMLKGLYLPRHFQHKHSVSEVKCLTFIFVANKILKRKCWCLEETNHTVHILLAVSLIQFVLKFFTIHLNSFNFQKMTNSTMEPWPLRIPTFLHFHHPIITYWFPNICFGHSTWELCIIFDKVKYTTNVRKGKDQHLNKRGSVAWQSVFLRKEKRYVSRTK